MITDCPVVSLKNLNPFSRPLDNSMLRDAEGNWLGQFDFHSSEKLILRQSPDKSIRADGWLDLMALVIATYGQE